MRIETSGVGIRYEVTGEGRPVVLLHGFPDSGRLWRHQVPALARAGFRVIVPDMRGYGRSDKPSAVDAYGVKALAGDVLAVMGDAGVEQAHIVGHDWGAAVPWGLAALASDRVDHLVALSVGHPATFRAGPGSSSTRSPGTCCCSSFPESPNSGCRPMIGRISAPGGVTRTWTPLSPSSKPMNR